MADPGARAIDVTRKVGKGVRIGIGREAYGMMLGGMIGLVSS